ncbi:hypothetical protein EDB85DRAFT_1898489 [Lactarius pseudohatsudake]|nr:hypothetical protein EDB85DRAFT_1898489 [Lactarius pseudohatsudake]
MSHANSTRHRAWGRMRRGVVIVITVTVTAAIVSSLASSHACPVAAVSSWSLWIAATLGSRQPPARLVKKREVVPGKPEPITLGHFETEFKFNNQQQSTINHPQPPVQIVTATSKYVPNYHDILISHVPCHHVQHSSFPPRVHFKPSAVARLHLATEGTTKAEDLSTMSAPLGRRVFEDDDNDNDSRFLKVTTIVPQHLLAHGEGECPPSLQPSLSEYLGSVPRMCDW